MEKTKNTFFSVKLILAIAAFLKMLPKITMSEDNHQSEEDHEAYRHRLKLFWGTPMRTRCSGLTGVRDVSFAR